MKDSQASRLLKLLQDGKPHSTPEIQRVVYGGDHLGVARIASRVDDLRKLGHVIENTIDPDNRAISYYQLKPKVASPYAPVNEPKVKSATDLFGNYRLPVNKAVGGGERGELLRYFCEKLNPGRIKDGYAPLDEKAIINILPYMNDIRSLFWLKSNCDDAVRRGYSFSKCFWYLAKQQKEEKLQSA